MSLQHLSINKSVVHPFILLNLSFILPYYRALIKYKQLLQLEDYTYFHTNYSWQWLESISMRIPLFYYFYLSLIFIRFLITFRISVNNEPSYIPPSNSHTKVTSKSTTVRLKSMHISRHYM